MGGAGGAGNDGGMGGDGGTVGSLLGCHMVGDVVPGVGWFAPRSIRRVGDKILFFGTTPATGYELWETDGTLAGTRLAVDIRPGPLDSLALPELTAVMGDALYFIADDGTSGRELWRSDGTVQGTLRISDLGAGAAHGGFSLLVATDSALFFSGTSNNDTELWTSDGTLAGTRSLDLHPTGSSNPENLRAVGHYAYLSATEPVAGREPWRSDGTPAGTHLVANLREGFPGSFPNEFVALGGAVYFRAQDSTGSNFVYRTDGTESGTQRISPSGSGGYELHVIGDRLYFSGGDAAHGSEPWVSDGTTEGTHLLADVWMGTGTSEPYEFTGVGDKIVFGALHAEYRNQELFVTDGTTEGTRLLRELWPGPQGNGYPHLFVAHGHELIFFGRTAEAGEELWVTDGTTEGTRLLRDFLPGPFTSQPRLPVSIGDSLYLAGNDGVHGVELWRCTENGDGTPPPDSDAPCEGHHGPSMVRFGVWCIDSTEVTAAQYAEFLAANVAPGGPHALCATNATFAPEPNSTACYDPVQAPNLPMVCIDWCDAAAYCAWAGKRLCGNVGAQPQSEQSQWGAVCSNYGANLYPYGNTYVQSRCNDERHDGTTDTMTSNDHVYPVGSVDCEGTLSGVHDLVGNVAEWNDDNWNFDRQPACGGGYRTPSADSDCETCSLLTRTTRSAAIGFRCCSP
jgi:ELWxxDGT repeat protein